MYQAGLVLEGGGMRGVYTIGVLDFLMEKDIWFSHLYGVSAGACHMCSYLSRQPGRALHANLDYLGRKDYCGVESLLTTGDFFNVKMCYYDIPEHLLPYDYEAFGRYEGKAYSVVTNIRTGEPEYPLLQEMHRDIEWVRASASLPLLSRNVKINGEYYLDGGITDAIPIKRSIHDGNRKNLVVLTKEAGYVRRPTSYLGLIRLRYLNYPKVYECMKERHLRYNATMRYLEEREEAGEAFVIRPKSLCGVGRIEKDQAKLRALYEQGRQDAEDAYGKLMEYLGPDQNK